MNGEDGFIAARELALTGRYREARDVLRRLLEAQPSRVDALILLGKVEYYLGRARSSRRRFETALTYDPANPAAFFGLEYHRGRRWTATLAGCAVLLAMALAALAFLVWNSSALTRRELDARMSALSGEYARSVDRATAAIEEVRGAAQRGTKDTDTRLAGTLTELSKLREDTAALTRGMEELRKAFAAFRHESEQLRKADAATQGRE